MMNKPASCVLMNERHSQKRPPGRFPLNILARNLMQGLIRVLCGRLCLVAVSCI